MSRRGAVEEQAARQLLHPERFDITAKWIYASHRGAGLEPGWPTEIYGKHIAVINGFLEKHGSRKLGASEFLQEFNSLLDDVASSRFDFDRSPVPISAGGVAQDGAHRIAACLVHDHPVGVCRVSDAPLSYPYTFFRNHGLDETSLDAMAEAYLDLLDNPFLALVFPAAEDKDDAAVRMLGEHGDVLYAKTISLTRRGALNLIRATYADEPWLGSVEDGFQGARNKADWCFAGRGPMRVVLLRSSLDRMKRGKEAIRARLDVGKHSIHIPDDATQTRQLARLLLNANGIHFLNYSHASPTPWFDTLLREYREWLRQDKLDPDLFCIDGGAVLSAYGLRDTRDLDYLTLAEGRISSGRKEISNHSSALRPAGPSVPGIVLDPRHHFHYAGLKFASLPVVLDAKRARGEEKDLEDLKRAKTWLASETPPPDSARTWGRLFREFTLSRAKAHLRFLALKTRFHVYTFLRRVRR